MCLASIARTSHIQWKHIILCIYKEWQPYRISLARAVKSGRMCFLWGPSLPLVVTSLTSCLIHSLQQQRGWRGGFFFVDVCSFFLTLLSQCFASASVHKNVVHIIKLPFEQPNKMHMCHLWPYRIKYYTSSPLLRLFTIASNITPLTHTQTQKLSFRIFSRSLSVVSRMLQINIS